MTVASSRRRQVSTDVRTGFCSDTIWGVIRHSSVSLNPTDRPLLLRGPLDLCITMTGVCPGAPPPPEKPNQSDLQGQRHAWVMWQAFGPWATSPGCQARAWALHPAWTG